ncbi:hypothetical protein BJ944DRAFT_274324 [Cunninghamella echinulata]|nr:hypothetical protein BJ944DRAFT_274324 [Cunninghamella echinulata]
MSSYNNTQTKLIRTTNRYSNITYTRLTPIPLPNESFYFNQDDVKAKIASIRAPFNNRVYKRTSVHVTDKRIIILAQPLSTKKNSSEEDDDDEIENENENNEELKSFQLDLAYTLSLKTTKVKKHKLILDISVQNQWESIQIHLSFPKKDASRRDSFKEYINLVMAGCVSKRLVISAPPPSPPSSSFPTSTSMPLMRHYSTASFASSLFSHRRPSDGLPSYLQALTDTSSPIMHSSSSSPFFNTREELPPAYS